MKVITSEKMRLKDRIALRKDVRGHLEGQSCQWVYENIYPAPDMDPRCWYSEDFDVEWQGYDVEEICKEEAEKVFSSCKKPKKKKK